MIKKRVPGEKRDPGETYFNILLFVYEHPEGIGSDALRAYLRKPEINIRSKTLIDAYLKRAEKDGWITRIIRYNENDKKFEPNLFVPISMDIKQYLKFFVEVTEFEEDKELAFFKTKSVQNFIGEFAHSSAIPVGDEIKHLYEEGLRLAPTYFNQRGDNKTYIETQIMKSFLLINALPIISKKEKKERAPYFEILPLIFAILTSAIEFDELRKPISDFMKKEEFLPYYKIFPNLKILREICTVPLNEKVPSLIQMINY